MSKVRVSITLRNHHHISFVVNDESCDLGEVVAELIKNAGKTFNDVLNISYTVIK